MATAPGSAGSAETETQAPEYTPRCTDFCWIFIFVLVLIGFIVLAAIDLTDYNKTKCFRSTITSTVNLMVEPTVLLVLVAAIITAMTLSTLYYSLATALTKNFIVATMLLQVLISLGCSIFYLVCHRWLTGSLNLAWTLLSVLVYWLLYNNIDYATVFLQAVVYVISDNFSAILISVLASIFSSAWGVLVGSVIMAGYGKTTSVECSAHHRLRPQSEFIGLLVYLTFTNCMVLELVKSILRASICSIYGYWYYNPNTPPSLRVQAKIWGGLHRALTFSLGSLCFMSLWLAVAAVSVQLLAGFSQLIILTASETVEKAPDISVVILVWFLSHCLTILDHFLGHFANYVVANIALYNLSCIEAAAAAVHLFRKEGCAAIVNDCLASGALTFGTWCIGSTCGLVCYIYMWQFTDYPKEGIYFITSYTVIIGSQIAGVLITGISSGAQTFFVALSNHPEILAETHPELAQELESVGRRLHDP